MEFKNILIVDDAPFIREILKSYLRSKGAELILEAMDGEEGVSVFKANEVDLIFMDIVMPKLSGIEAVKQIREVGKDVKIVGLSTLDSGSVINKMLEAGADAFVKKPFTLEKLDKIVSGEEF